MKPDRLDQAGVHADFALELLAERLRRHRRRRSADALEAIAHVRGVQRLEDFLVQAIAPARAASRPGRTRRPRIRSRNWRSPLRWWSARPAAQMPRLALATASACSFPPVISGIAGAIGRHVEVEPPRHHFGQHFGRAAERHVEPLEARGQPEALRGKMGRVAASARAVGERARLCLCGRDEILDRLVALGRLDHHHQRNVRERADGGQIGLHVEGEVGHRRRHHRERGARDQERVAVGIGLRDRAGADRLRCARAVLDHDGLADLLGDLLEHQPRDDVDGAAGRERHDHADRLPRRPFLGM